jgi:hypothetical protein
MNTHKQKNCSTQAGTDSRETALQNSGVKVWRLGVDCADSLPLRETTVKASNHLLLLLHCNQDSWCNCDFSPVEPNLPVVNKDFGAAFFG